MTEPERIGPGEFPFPLTRGTQESPYLTWVRNHSNYMGVRGLLDYLRAGGVVVRGMIVNFVILVPYLLAVAVVLAYSHHWMREHPFVVTKGVLAVGLGWIVLFALSLPILRIITHSRSVETGSESTVRQRDRYERSFGGVLLVAGAAAALESLPWILEFFHDRLQLEAFAWRGSLAMAAAGLAALSGGNRLLSVLSGVRKQVALVVVGILGAGIPLLVILAATDYLLYGLPPSFLWMLSPLFVPLVGGIGLGLAIILGVRRRVFTLREIAAVTGLLGGSVAVLLAVITASVWAVDRAQEGTVVLDRTMGPMRDILSQLENVEGTDDMTADVLALVEVGRVVHDRYEREDEELARSAGAQDDLPDSASWRARLDQARRDATLVKQYLGSQLPFGSLAYRLSALPEADIEPLRREMTRLARAALLDETAARVNERRRESDLRLGLFLGPYLSAELDYLGRADPLTGPDVTLGDIRERFAWLADNPEVLAALDLAVEELRAWDVSGLAELIDDSTLVRKVRTKYEGVPGAAQRAELEGRTELAAQLTKDELISLLIPQDPRERRTLLIRVRRQQLIEAAVPAFPAAEDSASEARRLATARELARLAELGLPVRSEGAADSLNRRLALFHRASAAPSQRLLVPGAPSGEAGDPSVDEIARAAGTRLARHALSAIDADYLRGLAFGEYSQPEFLAERLNVFTSDTAQARHLDEFLALGRRPLEVLAGAGFPASPGPGFVPYEDRNDGLREAIRDLRPASWPDGHRLNFMVAAKALEGDTQPLAALARTILIDRALGVHPEYEVIIDGFAMQGPFPLEHDELSQIAVASLRTGGGRQAEELVTKLMFGPYGQLDAQLLAELKPEITTVLMLPKTIFIVLLIAVILLATWITVDVNLTSAHGLYRDRLASAFLVGRDTKGDIGVEDDIDLAEICQYEARSSAPYHLINAALNLQGSGDASIRDRKSDFFFFSKRFIGGNRTGYCRSELMEQVFPQTDLATAMAISAAAAAPNGGRGTSPFLVAFMTLLNARLGFWLPNPGQLEMRSGPRRRERTDSEGRKPSKGFAFGEVFAEELGEIERRRRQAYSDGAVRPLDRKVAVGEPSVRHGLVGLAFSGGGIRSASINLGITQALHRSGVFDHVDYMSTVSGGGYIGSSLSTLMRARERLVSEVAGTVSIERGDEVVVTVTPSAPDSPPRTYRFASDATLDVANGESIAAGRTLLRPRRKRGRTEIAGKVDVEELGNGESIVRVTGTSTGDHREYRYSRFDSVLVGPGEMVKAGTSLIQRHDTQSARFRWRVRPSALVREALSKLDESHRWVNLSDGGHIENLAAVELLRRRCKYIIIGDGEADPKLHFAGLATLMRYASIDLGVHIDLDLDALRLREAATSHDAGLVSAAHFAVGTITYPPHDRVGEPEKGYLIYLKSSFTDDESEVIREYRHRHPAFPHQSTADQAFDENQLEAYRALGQHIAEGALGLADAEGPVAAMSFGEFEEWFGGLVREATKA